MSLLLNKFNWLFGRQSATHVAVTLSAEEWYEVKMAVESNIRREQEAIPKFANHPAMNGHDGVIDRTKHSLNVQRAALTKMP